MFGGRNGRKMGKWIFRPFFPLFLGGAKIHFFPFQASSVAGASQLTPPQKDPIPPSAGSLDLRNAVALQGGGAATLASVALHFDTKKKTTM